MFVAPHGEVETPGSTTQPYVRPAPRHVGRFSKLRPPASFRGERDVSDKPAYIRRLHRTNPSTATRVRADFRSRRESLLAVDEAIADVVGTLARTGRLASTYVLFTSDNGFFQGEHRIVKGKYLAYDPSTHVPLLIRGPGIAPGTVSKELVANTDLAPTLLDATGAVADIPVDGRSILPFARDPRLRTRRAVLHEGLVPGDIDRDGAPRTHRVPRYRAIRTGRYLWVEWQGGARELYDLARDPGQTHSRHRDPRYRRLRSSLHRELQRLRACAGDVVPAADRPAGMNRPPSARPLVDPSAMPPRLLRAVLAATLAALALPDRRARAVRPVHRGPGRDQRVSLAGHGFRRAADADLAARRAREPARDDPRERLAERPPRRPAARALGRQGRQLRAAHGRSAAGSGSPCGPVCRSAGRATAISRSGPPASPAG